MIDIKSPEEVRNDHIEYLLRKAEFSRKEDAMQSEHQTTPVFCGYCGASAIYDTDNERVITDWDTFNVQDPCDPSCHVPEDFLPEDPELTAIDKEMEKTIDSINRRTKLIANIDTMPVRMNQDGEDDSKSYLFGKGDR